jgi:GntR family transcriptional regulator
MIELEKKELDFKSGIPLYRQISTILKEYIEKRQLKMGDILPSETELIKIFNVSRMTARLALENLENDGLVIRKQGQGTFFYPKVKIDASKLYSFTEEIEKLGFKAGTKLLGVKIVKSKPRITDIFQFSSPQNVLEVIRLRIANSQPIGICTSYLNLPKFPELRFQDYSKLSLYKIFEKDLNLTILRASQTIMSDIVPKNEANLLKLKEGSPIVRVYRTTYVRENIPIDANEAIFDAKSYYYNSELYREKVVK